MKSRHHLTISVMTAAALWLTGCAATGEREANTVWENTYEHRQAMRPASPATFDSLNVFASSAELPALIDYAITHNPHLQAQFGFWQADLQKIRRERGWVDPNFSYSYFIEPIETRVGPMRQKFMLNQKFVLGKLGLRGEAAAYDADMAGATYDAELSALVYRVSAKWYEYYFLGRSIAITEENVLLLTHLESVARRQYAAGATQYSEVMRAQVELGRLEDELLTLRDRHAPVLASINADLNRPATAAIAWPDTIIEYDVAGDMDSLRTLLVTNNPDLEAMSSRVASEETRARLAGRGPIPDLTLEFEYIQTDPIANVNTPNNGQDTAIAKATINVPIWFGKYSAEKAEARARYTAATYQRTQLERTLVAELERVEFEINSAARRAELYDNTLLPKARQSLNVTEDAFIAGSADFLDLIDAQRTLLELELGRERARVDRAVRQAELERLVGMHSDNGGRM